MKKGKVIVIGGNKRAGKSTLSRKLQTEAGFNYYNMDHLTNCCDDAWFPEGLTLLDYFKFMESMIKYAVLDAERFGINSVFEFIYTPEVLNNLSCKDKVEIIYLADLDLNESNFKDVLIGYSKPYEYSANEADVERNKPIILGLNERLIKECKEYNARLVNTSFGENRNKIINELYNEIVNN